MKYDFDEIIDRKNTNSMSTDGFREYIFHAGDTMDFPYADDQFIRMWIADMEFATPEFIRRAIMDRIDKKIFGYTKVFDPRYYEVFLSWAKKMYGWTFKKEHLVTSPGVIPALYDLVGYICRSGEKILITTPSYIYFKHAADYNQISLICSDLIYNEGYYSINFQDFEEKAKDPDVTVCIFCNPHNPTGRIWSEEELRRVAEICFTNHVMLISDEIHCDLIRTGNKHIPLAKLYPDSDQIITCMSPSKTFNMAGFLFSNIIIPNKKVLTVWKERHYQFENPLSIAAAQAAYESGYDWLTELKLYIDSNFAFVEEYLKANLPNARFRISEATYLGWINISQYVDKEVDLPLFFANNAGVLLEGGDMFVANSDCCIRLNLACPRSILEEGLRRICGLLNKGFATNLLIKAAK